MGVQLTLRQDNKTTPGETGRQRHTLCNTYQHHLHLSLVLLLLPCLTGDGSGGQAGGGPGAQGGEGAGSPVWHLAAARYHEEEVWRGAGESYQLLQQLQTATACPGCEVCRGDRGGKAGEGPN